MKKELKHEFSEAVRLKKAGQLDSARQILRDLAEQDPDSTAVFAVLGQVCWDMQALEEAVKVFGRAVELSPTLEAVSLGLFHSLWKLDRRGEALEEINRFQSVSDSEDYREIIKEINEKFE